ncbi:glycosyltransferase [Paenibacillus sp. UNC451MF]|uniref:glycosyltransferase n=1 Tax=Paenibacillus sp. UNC451MF TaxID=1449063 RepID=UPI00048D99C1|nr:glycosyltransferase [Paenibacillus sp. UNC451MF]
MNQLWQYECVLTDADRRILDRINGMIGQWDAYPYLDVLQAYREFDFMLKRSFLALIQQIPTIQAYAILHNIWIESTKNLQAFYAERDLFPSPNGAVRLKDLIELSYFYAQQLLNRPESPAAVTPLISVILPVYQAQQYLWEALRSVYEQTFQDFELILVNGYQNGDPLEAILSVFEDTRTFIVQETEKARLGASLNLGIRQARGSFIARMDSDDIAHPERFFKQIKFLQAHPEIDFCGTQCRAFGTINNWNNKPYPLLHQELQCRSLKFCSFIHPSVMWRKEKFIENNLWYNEEVLAEDTDLFARVVFSLKTANLQETLLLYRREGANLSIEVLKKKNNNNQSLAVIQSIMLERNTRAALYQSLNQVELNLIQNKTIDSFTYRDALRIFKYRLGREDLSDLLPPDTSESETIFLANLNNRIPVIWGYGWNGQVLEYRLQEQGFKDYRIVDQRLQELEISLESPHAMRLEELESNPGSYYVLISMDKHFPEVTHRLESYGYAPQEDYIEFFV